METDSNLYFTILESELIDTIIQIDFSDFLKKYYLSKYCLIESTGLPKILILIKHSTRND